MNQINISTRTEASSSSAMLYGGFAIACCGQWNKKPILCSKQKNISDKKYLSNLIINFAID